MGRFILDDYIDLDQISGGGVSALAITTDETNNTLKITATNTDESTIDSNVVDLSWLKGTSVDTTKYITSGKVSGVQPSEATSWNWLLQYTFSNENNEDKITIDTPMPLSIITLTSSDYTYISEQYFKGWQGGPELNEIRRYFAADGSLMMVQEGIPLSYFNSDTQEWECRWKATGDIAAETDKPACYKYGVVHGPLKTTENTKVAIDETGAMWYDKPKGYTSLFYELSGLAMGTSLGSLGASLVEYGSHGYLMGGTFTNTTYSETTSVSTYYQTIHHIEANSLYVKIYLTDASGDYWEIDSSGLVTHAPTTSNDGTLSIHYILGPAIS